MNTDKEMQLAKILKLEPDFRFDNLIVTHGNRYAVDSAKNLCCKMEEMKAILQDKNALHLKKIWDLSLYGEGKVGKTHLARAVQNRLIASGFSVFYADGKAYSAGLLTPKMDSADKEEVFRRTAREFIEKFPADLYIFDDFELPIIFTHTQRVFLWIRQELNYKPVITVYNEERLRRNDFGHGNSMVEDLRDYLGLTGKQSAYCVDARPMKHILTGTYSFRNFSFGVNSAPDITLTEQCFKKLMANDEKNIYRILLNMSKLGTKRISMNNSNGCW